LQDSDDALMYARGKAPRGGGLTLEVIHRFLHVCKHVARCNPVKTFEGHFLQTLLRLEVCRWLLLSRVVTCCHVL